MTKVPNFWNVKIAWNDDRFSGSYTETRGHIPFDKASTAIHAIMLCAEWRNSPAPQNWILVSAVLVHEGETGWPSL